MTETLDSRFFERSRQWGNRTAVAEGTCCLSYSDLASLSCSLAVALREKGFHRENIGLLLSNSQQYPLAFFGILNSGNTVVPINPLLQPSEMMTIIRHSEMRLILTESAFSGQVQNLKDNGMGGVEFVEVSNLALSTENHGQPFPVEEVPAPALILYTSGTTGDPKGVLLSHQNILSNCDAFSSLFCFSEADHFISVLPLFHTFAITVCMLGSLYSGAALHLLPKFQPRPVYDLLKEVPSGIFIAVPSMFNVMAKLPGDTLPNQLRVVVSGGAALPLEIQRGFESKFGVEIHEGYGLTEAAPVVCSNRPGFNRPGTIGPALPGIEVQVWDDGDKPLPPGQPGELVTRGANVMLGYYKNEQATAQAITPEGWLRTGDIAVLDPEGYVRIVGRKKELIISAGMNIYPREIEEVLQSCPGVLEAAVVGMPDPLRGEVPRAFVVPMEGVSLKPQELRQRCRKALAEFKVPRVFEIVEALPKTSTGKIAKKLLISQSRVENCPVL